MNLSGKEKSRLIVLLIFLPGLFFDEQLKSFQLVFVYENPTALQADL